MYVRLHGCRSVGEAEDEEGGGGEKEGGDKEGKGNCGDEESEGVQVRVKQCMAIERDCAWDG
jgi:hypothetical protein